MNIKVSIFILLFIVFFAFFGGVFYRISPYDLNPIQILHSPSLEHLFGTDRLGRDLLARIIEGTKISLIIGFLSASITSIVGLFIGINGGYFKGTIDKTIVITIDLFLTFPTFFLLLALVSYVDASMFVIIIVLSITGWMGTARLIRSESFAIGNKPYIKIMKLARVSNIKIIFKYFAPLIAPIFLVSFTFGVGGAILGESALSFLGLGINPPQMSLGTILSDGKGVMDVAPWISFFGGLFIFLITYCLVQISNYLQSQTNTKDIQSF
jgi:peptide/nickel transport system permease protein